MKKNIIRGISIALARESRQEVFRNNCKDIAAKYEVNTKVVYPHSFRHRFAKNFLEKFNDIALLADLTGYESIETTRIYLRRTAGEQRAARNCR
jgi:site-specific recombinase XerD